MLKKLQTATRSDTEQHDAHCLHPHKCTRGTAYGYTRKGKLKQTLKHTNTHTQTQTYTHTSRHRHTHTHTHTHTLTHTHTHTWGSVYRPRPITHAITLSDKLCTSIHALTIRHEAHFPSKQMSIKCVCVCVCVCVYSCVYTSGM